MKKTLAGFVATLALVAAQHQNPLGAGQEIKSAATEALPFDRTSPVIYDNDGSIESGPTDLYIAALASAGVIDLRGIITTTSYGEQARVPPYKPTERADHIRERQEFVDKARRSGLGHLPDVTAGPSISFMSKWPSSWRIEDTGPLDTEGGRLILDEARKASAARPLVVLMGGAPTAAVDAYLMDPTIADKMVLVWLGGNKAADGGVDALEFNAGTDPWGTYIAFQRLRLVLFPYTNNSDNRDDPAADTPKSRFLELPDTEVRQLMIESRWPRGGGLFSEPVEDLDAVPVVALTRPDFVRTTKRVSFDKWSPAPWDLRIPLPSLREDAQGRVLVVWEASRPVATDEWWRRVKDGNAWGPATNGGPMLGTPWALPGTIEAEHFDHGGTNRAYWDTTNNWTDALWLNTFRMLEHVDIRSSANAAGGYKVSETHAGEWMQYTARVDAAGLYRFEFRVSSLLGGGAFRMDVDGVNATGPLTMPATLGLDAWRDLTTAAVPLTAGVHTLRLVMLADGLAGSVGDFDSFRVTTTAPADFTFSATPGQQTVAAGGSANYAINVSGQNGFSGTVGLSVSGLPAGVSATFTPASVIGSGASTLSVSTSATTPAGVYALAATGVSGNLTHGASVTLTVAANGAPDGVITSPTGNVTITPGGSVTFSGTGSDPDNNLPLTYAWNFGVGGPVPSTSQNPGAVVFPTAGIYVVTFTVRDSLGLADPTPATRTVTVGVGAPAGVIPQGAWTLQSVDSAGPGYPGTYAFDDDAKTAWTTSWTPTVGPLPHDIQINLGAIYAISGFRHLPRQDSFAIGRIGQYEFYVSLDGIDWGTAVAKGTLADTAARQEVLFPAKTGRYVRLRALTSLAGAPYTTLAELNVLGAAAPNQPPDSTIATPTANVTIAAGGSVTFSGTGSDPDGNLPLTYAWKFGTGGPGPSTSQNPGAVVFPTAGIYTVTFTVSDRLGLSDPTPATRTITVGAGPIPQTNWTLKYVDSQELTGWNNAAIHAFDADPHTAWATQWLNGQPPPPHEIQIDLNGLYSVSGFRYLPRPDSSQGRVAQYEFYVSADGSTWGSAVATGAFPDSATEQQVLFAAKTGRYIRFRALTEVTGVPVVVVHELNVIGAAASDQPPDSAITAPTGNVTIAPGGSVTFSGTGSDPKNSLPLTYAWNFGAGGPAPSTSQNPGAVVFPTAGIYAVTFTVSNSLGLSDPTPATRTITVGSGVISQTNWTLEYVDSQELAGWDNAATHAFDGDPDTAWATQWLNGQPPPPHEIQIDLHGVYSVSGFRYLPRPDSSHGRIAQYEFYVSADGRTWGAAVATGTFPDAATEQQVLFTAKTGRYIRFRALTEVGKRPVIVVQELNVVGAALAN